MCAVLQYFFDFNYSWVEETLYLTECSTYGSTIVIVLFIVIAYIVGQLISFLSSRTIETYSNFKYNYPSIFLLNLQKESSVNSHFSLKLLRLIVSFVIVHVCWIDHLISYLFSEVKFITKPISRGMSLTIIEKVNKLFESLDLKIDKIEYGQSVSEDFHRVVMHYVFENTKNHRSKLNNYVALYGFHRSMSFIFNVSSWMVVWELFRNICAKNLVGYVVSYFILSIMSYLFFVSFMKFYRRFTLEGYMILIIDKKE